MCKGKRSYIAVCVENSCYRVYLGDLKEIRKVAKKRTPRLPTFEPPSPKPEQLTDVDLEFEPLDLQLNPAYSLILK